MGATDVMDVGGPLVKGKHIKEVELMLQSGPEENAAAALAMVLTFHGKEVSPWDLSDEPLDTAADLLAAARARGLYAEGYQMTMQELCKAPFPLIAHWRFHSFVVVTGVYRGKVYVNSPDKGRQVFSLADFEAGFTGVCLCFAGSTEPGKEKKARSARGVAAYFPSAGVLLVICQLFLSACCVTMAMLLRSFAGDLTASNDSGGHMALLFGMTVTVQTAVALLQLWVLHRCEKNLCGRAEHFCSEALAEKSPLFLERVQKAQLSAVCDGCSEVPAAMARSAFCALQTLTIAACLLSIAVQEPVSGVIAFVVVTAFAVVLWAQRGVLYSDAKLTTRDRFDIQFEAAEALQNSERSCLMGQGRRRFEEWMSKAAGQARKQGAERQIFLWYAFGTTEVFAVLFVCLLRLLSGAVSMAGVAACLWLAGVIAVSMGALPVLLERQMTLRGLLDGYRAVFRTSGTAKEPSGPLPQIRSLTLQNAALASEDRKKAGLKGITMDVHRGEILAVYMDHCSDSRALSQVLAGIKAPTQGELYLGSVDAAELDEETVYSSVTLLGQGIPRPSGTVRDNIAAGCGSITDYAIVQAASDALLHESILLREKGYDTPASTLSDGEKVLLEFACAFARGTPFLVGDCITQAFDPDTETGLLQAIRRRDIGAVLLTQTPELLRQADMVCRIEAGRLTLRERAEFLDWEGGTSLAKQA